MARHRKHNWDEEKTARLGRDELLVEKVGGSTYYEAWLVGSDLECCPVCGCTEYKVHNLFKKQYIDIIKKEGFTDTVTLMYMFYKYRCLNPDCGRVFADPILFANPADNVTFRLADYIAENIVAGKSYFKVSESLRFDVTRQSIGNIFKRWVGNKMVQLNAFAQPKGIAVFSGSINHGANSYFLFICLDAEYTVVNVMMDAGFDDIVAYLSSACFAGVDTVLTDCSSTVVEAVDFVFPQALHIVPIQAWFRLVTEDYMRLVKKPLQQRQEPHKYELITSEPSADQDRDNLNYILEARPTLKEPYRDYIKLKKLISNNEELWVYTELKEWENNLCPSFSNAAETSLLVLNRYEEYIKPQENYRDAVPALLFSYLSTFDEALENSFCKYSTDQQLKATALLTINKEHFEKGTPLKDIVDYLYKRNNKQEINANDYQ